MLSIEQCRELLADGSEMTDERIAELRMVLYRIAELALEVYFGKTDSDLGLH